MNMATHSPGQGKRHLSVGLPEDLHGQVLKAAAASGLSVNAYVNALLGDALEKGLLVREKREVYVAHAQEQTEKKS
jgi:hypothetical protein